MMCEESTRAKQLTSANLGVSKLHDEHFGSAIKFHVRNLEHRMCLITEAMVWTSKKVHITNPK